MKVFISSNFRTGSALFSQILRNTTTSIVYSEPLHPTLKYWLSENDKEYLDMNEILSHDNTNYFREFKDLEKDEFLNYYNDQYAKNKIILHSNDVDLQLKNYIDFLFNSAPERTIIFQTTRMNFRLPWVKSNFPEAKIINLRRNARDIYTSYINVFEKTKGVYDSDESDLGQLFELNYYLNFINSHFLDGRLKINKLGNYEKIFLTQLLSNNYSRKYCDLIINYKQLVINPDDTLKNVYELLDVEPSKNDIIIKKGSVNRWKSRHPKEWYITRETKCKEILKNEILPYLKNRIRLYPIITSDSKSDKLKNDPLIIFLHIPKAGGTTLNQLFDDVYGQKALDTSRRKASLKNKSVGIQGILKNEKSFETIRMVKGNHYQFGVHNSIKGVENIKYISLLRDPIDRLISHYYYVKSRKNHKLHHIVNDNDWSVLDYCMSDVSVELDNGITRQISGCKNVDVCTEKEFNRAVKNIEKYFVAIGLLDQFDLSLKLFQKKLGWSHIPEYKKLNTRRSEKIEVSEKIKDKIRARNIYDVRLYEMVSEEFWSQLKLYNLE